MTSYFLQNVKDKFYVCFYRLHGLNLAKFYRLQKFIQTPIDFDKYEHIALQARDFSLWWHRPINSDHEWLTPESYYIDWRYSSRLQVETLEEGLNDAEAEARCPSTTPDLDKFLKTCTAAPELTPDFVGFSAKYYSHHPQESHLITRVLFRRMQEEKPNHSDLTARELMFRAMDALRADLNREKTVRKIRPGAKLNYFMRCQSIQSLLLRRCAKSIARQLGFIALFFFAKNYMSHK